MGPRCSVRLLGALCGWILISLLLGGWLGTARPGTESPSIRFAKLPNYLNWQLRDPGILRYLASGETSAIEKALKATVIEGDDELLELITRTFLKELEVYTDCPELMKDLQIYEVYCQNKLRSESLWGQYSNCAFFQECQKKWEHKLGLDSYLLKPVQRITKYQVDNSEFVWHKNRFDA